MKKMKKLHNNPWKGPSTKYDHFMRVSMGKNEENEKWDYFMRVSMDKNEENEKYD